MKLKEMWIFPVPSTQIYHGVNMLYPGANAILLFDYHKNDHIYKAGIKFEMVRAFRHLSEGFGFLEGAYDTLVEVENSKWSDELSKVNPFLEKNYNYKLRHFAIYLDSNGLYEFIAHNFMIIEPKLGELDETIDELCEIK